MGTRIPISLENFNSIPINQNAWASGAFTTYRTSTYALELLHRKNRSGGRLVTLVSLPYEHDFSVKLKHIGKNTLYIYNI